MYTPSGSQPPAGRPGFGTYALFVLTGGWAITVCTPVQFGSWFVDQILLIEDTPLPGFAWPLIELGQAFLLLLPILPLALATRLPRFRAIYQTWLIAVAGGIFLSFARVVPRQSTQAATLVQAAICLLLAFLLVRLARRRGAGLTRGFQNLASALTIAAIVAVPWLVAGALGSPLDTLLTVAAGLSFGLLAGLGLDLWLFRGLATHSEGSGWDIAAGGFAAGVALLILATGFGFTGSQILLMLCLPPLGYAVAAIALSTMRLNPCAGWLPASVLIGCAAAAPVTLIDPTELLLILGTVELPAVALAAAGASATLAGFVGVPLWALRNRGRSPSEPGVTLARRGAAGVAWACAALVYVATGQPGFYGDQIFVILRNQADVTPALSIAEREARLRFVYETLTQQADATQARLRGQLDRLGVAYSPYYLVNALEVDGGPLLRAYLEQQPEVDRVLVSPRLRPLPIEPPVEPGERDAPSQPQWNITSIGADRVWTELGVTGEGIVVGQSDSGVQGDHPALADGYRGKGGEHDYNWLDPWYDTPAPVDHGDHGTHTLGSAVGRDGIGVAPGAEWFACANLARNIGNPARYLDCLQFMLAPYPQEGNALADGDPGRAAHVLNNSWGCPLIEGCDPMALRPAIEALRAAGIFVVASAGNTGPECASVSDPIALYDEAFSVGAVDAQGDVTTFSSRGPVTVDGSGRVKPDILAPGDEVLSALPSNSYGRQSGTSMAGPHVAGVVALMWSAQPRLIGNIDRTEQILAETAGGYSGRRNGCFDEGPTADLPNNAVGYGVVDAYAAVQAAQAER